MAIEKPVIENGVVHKIWRFDTPKGVLVIYVYTETCPHLITKELTEYTDFKKYYEDSPDSPLVMEDIALATPSAAIDFIENVLGKHYPILEEETY